MRVASLLLAASLVLVISGCRKGKGWTEREVDYSLVRIDSEHLNLRHDTVGHDKWESQATFALVDAYNEHDEDLLVTLGGDLVAADGRVVGAIRTESLRIPAGGVRTFAMIDHENRVRPEATSARIRVMGAYVPDYVPSVQITDGKIHKDGDRVVANAVVRNAVDRPVRVIVIAGFYDSGGKPLTRPFTDMYLPASGDHTAQFVGPPGSVKGYIFVGDMVY